MASSVTSRLRRLAEELDEIGVQLSEDRKAWTVILEEIDHALRPVVHERRVVSTGTIIGPGSDPTTWASATDLEITRAPLGDQPLPHARRFADGLSSWILRRMDEPDEWMLFNRAAGSERDLVVLAAALHATVVQRHPAGTVRVVGTFGVLRWEGLVWHHEPPISGWVDTLTAQETPGDPAVLKALLAFAVHDLGSLGIGASLIYRADDSPSRSVEERMPSPPPVNVRRPTHLAPLRHALAQVDGAAIFDVDGVLRRLGVRLVPTTSAEETVQPLRGTRHTSARRYSRDDPNATVIVVSEDGPVTVLRNGVVVVHGELAD